MNRYLLALFILPLFLACGEGSDGYVTTKPDQDSTALDSFVWEVDNFGDKRVLRYQIPGWEQLSLQQKKLAYYLTMAGLSGRDIMWDQNYRHNLKVRRALERVIKNHKGERSGAQWDAFLVYAKQVFFSNGIHHHYGMDKFIPECRRTYFDSLLAGSGATIGKEVVDILFDPAVDAKKVSLDPDKDLVLSSAVNFFGDDINQKEVEAYYGAMEVKGDTTPLSYGINSKVVRGKDGRVTEQVWKVGGMYGKALEQMVMWLEKAQGVAESPAQAKVLGLLIEFYRTGDLQKWDDFNIAWVEDKTSTVDLIQGFVEVYNDPMGKKGSYESCVEVIDPVATKNMRADPGERPVVRGQLALDGAAQEEEGGGHLLQLHQHRGRGRRCRSQHPDRCEPAQRGLDPSGIRQQERELGQYLRRDREERREELAGGVLPRSGGGRPGREAWCVGRQAAHGTARGHRPCERPA